MPNTVELKSYRDGIKILLDPNADISAIKTDLIERLRKSSDFLGNIQAVISFEGRKLDPQEETDLVNAVRDNSMIDVICTAGRDEDTDREYVHAIKKTVIHNDMAVNIAQIYRGSILSGQKMETENSIVIMGDVSEDASIISDKDIIILGALYGAAFAGGDGLGHHFVAALDMSPQVLKIGETVYSSNEKPPARWLRLKAVPRIAYEDAGIIIMEPMTKEMLENIPE